MSALPPIADLYRDQRRRSLAIVRRILHDEAEAEDVVQEVFAKLYSQPVQFDGKALCTTWLHRILVNSSINSLRARNRRSRLESPEPACEDPETQVVGKERHERLLGAMEILTEQHRMMITLRDLKGYSYTDIARMLGVAEGTVKSALNRGRTRLMKEVQARSGEGSADAMT